MGIQILTPINCTGVARTILTLPARTTGIIKCTTSQVRHTAIRTILRTIRRTTTTHTIPQVTGIAPVAMGVTQPMAQVRTSGCTIRGRECGIRDRPKLFFCLSGDVEALDSRLFKGIDDAHHLLKAAGLIGGPLR